MALRVRTFRIHDASTEDDEAALDRFLASVDVDRIDTAAAADGWRIAVLFQDQRGKEESEQIASVVAGALRTWRAKSAASTGKAPAAILADEDLDLIARGVPTTTVELRSLLGASDDVVTAHANDIVSVVRDTMDALS